MRSYVNNKCLHVEISRSIEYACGVKSETITLNKKVDLTFALISLLSEEILSGSLRVRLEFAGRIVGYDTSTRYRSDGLSIPG